MMIGILSALVNVFEGLPHLNQYHESWLRYHSTCESLKHVKYIFYRECGTVCQHGEATRVAGRVSGITRVGRTRQIDDRASPGTVGEVGGLRL
jgi:hypothetical protein